MKGFSLSHELRRVVNGAHDENGGGPVERVNGKVRKDDAIASIKTAFKLLEDECKTLRRELKAAQRGAK